MKKYAEMKVNELKTLCKKSNISGYSRMKKKELVTLLENHKEARKVVIAEARDNAKNELGKDFTKAVSFWKQLKGIKYMSANDYTELVDKWKIITSLFNNIEENGVENRTITDSLIDTAESLKNIFCPTANISNYSDDELKEFINNYLEEFSLSVFSKRLKKENTEIIKMSMDHISYNENGVAYFDSSKASKFTGKEVKAHKTDMRIVESSEDGISRMLMEKGLSSITIFMGKTAKGEEEMAMLNNCKDNIFRNGLIDIATGKRYIFAFQNPSSCRKSNFMFVEANNWNEVVALWCEITGFKSFDDFKTEFFDAEGKVIMAKLLARISTRGSNSFNLSKISPVWAEKIAKANIDYCKDPKWTITRDFKTMKGPGCMEMQTGVERTLTPGDGQMIGSFEFHALMAVSLRVISENEYNEFITLWKKAKKNIANVKEGSRLYKLVKKIPGVFQLRHGEKKGICVRYNLEAVPELKNIDAIVPDSVRKFVAGEWHEFPLEICNYIKRKDEWVALNPQFIEALGYENPNALNVIVDYWFNYMKESLSDTAKAQQFHGIIKSSDDEDSKTVAGNLVAAMRTSSDLIDDAQICNWRKDQYRKFISDMKIGRILVPGMYTYMVCDPAFIINAVYGTNLPCLGANEYYHNNKNCECGLFRSPLIHPFEVQKVNLTSNNAYWYMQNVIVFNGYDGAWDSMGGADFDGDTCAVIPNDTEFGKLVVDGIRCIPFDIWEEAQVAIKKEFNMNNFIDYLVSSAKVDRTGVITNYASKALDISNHLKSAVYFAKLLGCENITLLHPQSFGTNNAYGEFGSKYEPKSQMIDGKKSFCLKGFVEAKYNAQTKNVEFADTGFVGTFSFERILEISNNFMDLVEILRILQGREIDGAKTGVYAEGVSGEDFIDTVKVKFTPHQMIIRQETLDREVAESSKINEFWSLSPLARIHDYVCKRESEIMDYLANGSNKIFLLQSLLTEEEVKALNQSVLMTDGSTKTLIEYLAFRKSGDKDKKKNNPNFKGYNDHLHDILENLEEEDKTIAMKSLKEAEKEALYDLALKLNTSPEVVAVASYIATYTKDSKQTEGLTYAWLLFDELLSVFSRGNKKFELFRLPAHVEKAFIKDKVLYVNGLKHTEINANDCENVVIQLINGRPYGLIHKIVDNVVAPRKPIAIATNKVYKIGTYGFKYHILAEDAREEWKRLVKENDFVFDITMDNTNRAVLSINGKSISALMPVGADFDLMNKRVKVVNNMQTNPLDETNGTIKNLQVVIIGEIE
jgi:hypothetical protein